MVGDDCSGNFPVRQAPPVYLTFPHSSLTHQHPTTMLGCQGRTQWADGGELRPSLSRAEVTLLPCWLQSLRSESQHVITLLLLPATRPAVLQVFILILRTRWGVNQQGVEGAKHHMPSFWNTLQFSSKRGQNANPALGVMGYAVIHFVAGSCSLAKWHLGTQPRWYCSTSWNHSYY